MSTMTERTPAVEGHRLVVCPSLDGPGAVVVGLTVFVADTGDASMNAERALVAIASVRRRRRRRKKLTTC